MNSDRNCLKSSAGLGRGSVTQFPSIPGVRCSIFISTRGSLLFAHQHRGFVTIFHQYRGVVPIFSSVPGIRY